MLCILAAPFFLTATLFLNQYHLKQTAYNRLKNEHLVCVTFSYTQAKDVKPGSEIKVNGEMMDVQSVSRWQDKVLVYGYYDEEEEALNDKLAVMNRQSNQKAGDHLLVKVLQLFMLPCTCQPPIHLQHFTGSTLQLYISFTATIPMVCLPVATPPPLKC